MALSQGKLCFTDNMRSSPMPSSSWYPVCIRRKIKHGIFKQSRDYLLRRLLDSWKRSANSTQHLLSQWNVATSDPGNMRGVSS